MSPLHQHFTVFGGAYVEERHDDFSLPAATQNGSLAPWGAVLATLLIVVTTFAAKTTAAAMNNVTLLASLN
jgi:hypothetical protein